MINVRKSQQRGHARHGWLESYHTFSFANYYDPKHTGFRDLLVINEDRVQPGQGFGKHSHQDMEIISYVMEGELEHRDSMGTGSVIRPGDVQRMSAGRGVQHSEFNHSKEKLVHFFQIWIAPSKEGIKPSYEEKKFSSDDKKNRLRLIVSPTGEEGSLTIHQDAKLFASVLDEGKAVDYRLGPGRHGWVQVLRGGLELNGEPLSEGDGAAISEIKELNLVAKQASEVLVFDLP
jgi:redox-sensitive bicupin YhaK (pirin superfamily)